MTFEVNDYIVRVYKIDKRTKAGERLVYRQAHTKTNKQHLEHLYRTTWLINQGFRCEITLSTT